MQIFQSKHRSPDDKNRKNHRAKNASDEDSDADVGGLTLPDVTKPDTSDNLCNARGSPPRGLEVI